MAGLHGPRQSTQAAACLTGRPLCTTPLQFEVIKQRYPHAVLGWSTKKDCLVTVGSSSRLALGGLQLPQLKVETPVLICWRGLGRSSLCPCSMRWRCRLLL